MKDKTRRLMRHIIRGGLLLAVSIAPVRAAPNYTTPYYFSTLAGTSSISSPGSKDGPGSESRFNGPYAVAVDGQGNLFVADNFNRTIRKITPAGVVTTFAGTAGVDGSTDGPGSAALFGNPWGIAADSQGNVYVADAWACTIRKITPEGIVTTLAGLAFTEGSADGMGNSARFKNPSGLAVDGSGIVYVVDSGNKTIRKITPAGVVTTLAGMPGVPGWNPLDGPMPNLDGTGSAARFISLWGIAVDQSGYLYVTDEETIRKISPAGVVTTFAGKAGGENWGTADGAGSTARFSGPKGVAVDASGTVYVADTWNNTIRKITPGGEVTTLAGLPAGYPPAEFSTNSTDGAGSVARFNLPQGVAADATGTIYVADTHNNTIRKITPSGLVSTLAGISPFQSVGTDDGPGRSARFASPHGTAVDRAGNVYVADCYNHTIRKISAAGMVTTLAGTAGTSGSTDGAGSVALFYFPKGVAVDAAGTIYVADTGNNAIRKISATGAVTTLAGKAGFSDSTDGTGSAARFLNPEGVAVDTAGTIYVTDTGNDTVRKISVDGMVTTLAGQAGFNGSIDGLGREARFNNPKGVAVDGTGTVYVADSGNFVIRKITTTGLVTTFAGQAGSSGWVDALGGDARFYGPEGLSVDGTGTLYVADNENYSISKYIYGGLLMIADGGSYAIRKITPAGLVSTVAGQLQGDSDGIGIKARFDMPYGVAADAAGNIYVSNRNLYSNTIRKGQLAGPPVITAQPQSLSVTAGNSVLFSVSAAAAPAATYQWYYNGNPYSGATTEKLGFASAQAADAGDYTVIITNELGAVTSSKATLAVTAAPAPVPASTQKSGGGGDGGALDGWFVLALLACGLLRRRAAGH